jgi:hypothetical protein
MIPAVGESDRYCLHRLDEKAFCYAPPSHVLVRPYDGFATPVCDAHVQAAQLAIRGHLEVVPIEMWLAGARGSRPGVGAS